MISEADYHTTYYRRSGVVGPRRRRHEFVVVVRGSMVGELVARLQDPDPVERVGALYALANVSDAGVITHVVPLLEDDDKYIRVLAARTLERSNARSGVQPLLVALEDVDVEVRESAVSALRAITGRQFLYDPRGESAERRTAVVRWRAWWGENWKAFLYGEE